ncbi:MAG: alpha/beta hydrolase [Symploca sp. SIO1B1]|nr:alpha/beta hydrolase [Symploca sp. SIO1C2]NER98818.1 alpha/beta hydrolase [Symploca sp. SIO1B1]
MASQPAPDKKHRFLKKGLTQKIHRFHRYRCFIEQSTLSVICLTLCYFAAPASAAERLTLRLGPLESSVAIAEIEEFAQTGELSSSLKPYRKLLTPQLQQALNRKLEINPNLIEKFINNLLGSADSPQILEQLGSALPDSSLGELNQALSVAIREKEGLSLLGFLRAYPQESFTVNASAAVTIALQLNASRLQGKAIGPILEQKLSIEDQGKFVSKIDPTAPGSQYVWEKTLRLEDQQRERTIKVDLHWARNSHGPLVVFSHGYGSDRKFLTYLARHLASHGISVASVEHPNSNYTWIDRSSVGEQIGDILPASEFIDRPQDISFALDRITQISRKSASLRGKFNTQQVSVIGHSLGGYTALVLAGGKLDLEALRQFCKNRSPFLQSPADWFQCAAAALPDNKVELQDERVVQVIAFNTVTGHLFGKDGLAQVTTPTLIFTGTEDFITPSLNHQLRAFAQLGSSKYLVSAIGGTHLSVTDQGNLNDALARSTLVKEEIGSEAEPLRQLARSISLAFIQQLTPEAEIYQPFLTPAYVQSLSNSTISLRLHTELPTALNAWLEMSPVGSQPVSLPPAENFSWNKIKSSLSNSFNRWREWIIALGS